jgi:Autotransporter beta-domain
MFNKSIAIVLLLTAATHAAHADDETVDMTGDAKPADPAPIAIPGVNSSGAPFEKGTIGLSFPVTLLSNITSAASVTAERVPTVDILYFLGPDAALDLVLGVNVHDRVIYNNATPPMAMDATFVGLAAGLGYRMYKHRNKVATYLEPQAVLEWTNLKDSATFSLSGVGLFGVEVFLSEWASLSGAIGAGVRVGNKFDDIQLATVADLAANLYWK